MARHAGSAVIDPEVQQEMEVAQSKTPMAKAVVGTTHNVRTPGGQIIPVGEMLDPKQAPTAGRAVDAQFNSLVGSIRARHEETGIEPATILNFLPIPLVVNSPMQDLKIRIPAAPTVADESDAFSFFTWHNAAIEVMDRGEGIKQPWDYLPRQIARAFLNEYEPFGGVVLMRGIPDEKTLSKPENVKMIQEARDRMTDWMVSKVHEANGEWNTANRSGAKNIVELHRQCAMRLKDLGLIDHLPEWITESRSLKDVQAKCPLCSVQPQPGAVECVNCHYVLDPAQAFVRGAISEEDASLERLSRKELEELGVSAYVAETLEERPERLKRGDPKPMSIAQKRALQRDTPSVDPASQF
jgi:hypothetical protein